MGKSWIMNKLFNEIYIPNQHLNQPDLIDQSIFYKEISENLILENEKNEHIIQIFNYQKNLRLSNFINYDNSSFVWKRQEDESIEFEIDSKHFFKMPEVKKYKPFEYKNYFDKVQSWIGYILSVSEDSFLAKIEDPNEIHTTYEEAEFSIDDVEEEDKKLLLIGSVFYWSVGYEYRGGTKTKQSILRFKRLP